MDELFVCPMNHSKRSQRKLLFIKDITPSESVRECHKQIEG